MMMCKQLKDVPREYLPRDVLAVYKMAWFTNTTGNVENKRRLMFDTSDRVIDFMYVFPELGPYIEDCWGNE